MRLTRRMVVLGGFIGGVWGIGWFATRYLSDQSYKPEAGSEAGNVCSDSQPAVRLELLRLPEGSQLEGRSRLPFFLRSMGWLPVVEVDSICLHRTTADGLRIAAYKQDHPDWKESAAIPSPALEREILEKAHSYQLAASQLVGVPAARQRAARDSVLRLHRDLRTVLDRWSRERQSSLKNALQEVVDESTAAGRSAEGLVPERDGWKSASERLRTHADRLSAAINKLLSDQSAEAKNILPRPLVQQLREKEAIVGTLNSTRSGFGAIRLDTRDLLHVDGLDKPGKFSGGLLLDPTVTRPIGTAGPAGTALPSAGARLPTGASGPLSEEEEYAREQLQKLGIPFPDSASSGEGVRAIPPMTGSAFPGTYSAPSAVTLPLTVSIADSWAWCLLTLALGVYLAFVLGNYYRQGRALDSLRLEVARTWEEAVLASESRFYASYGGLAAGYAMAPLLRSWLKSVLDEISVLPVSGQPAAAAVERLRSTLRAVEAYAARFERFRASAVQLEGWQASLEAQMGGDVPSPEDVPILDRSRRILIGSPPDDAGPEGTQLAAKQEEIEEVAVLVRRLHQGLKAIDRYLAGVSNILHRPDLQPTDRTRLVTAQEQLQGLRHALIRTETEEEIRGISGEAEQLFRSLSSAISVGALGRTFDVLPGPIPASDRAEEAPPLIMGEVVTPFLDTESPAGFLQGEADDLFLLRCRYAAGVSKPERVRWIFGDEGESPAQTFRTDAEGRASVLIVHRFRTLGEKRVRLVDDRNVAQGEPITLHVVSPPGRWRRGLSSLKKTEAQMTLISGTIAVMSGLAMLYFGSSDTSLPVWGTPGDYLRAFLWGSVVSEATKWVANGLVGNLISRVWPLPNPAS
jgi:hypothetical protein